MFSSLLNFLEQRLKESLPFPAYDERVARLARRALGLQANGLRLVLQRHSAKSHGSGWQSAATTPNATSHQTRETQATLKLTPLPLPRCRTPGAFPRL